MTMELIRRIELGSAQPAIEFTNINSDYTDLCLVVSARSSRNAGGDSLLVTFNGSTASFSSRWLEGDGATVATGTQARLAGGLSAASNTSNTFASIAIYIPDYRSSSAKSYSVDSVSENDGVTAYQDIIAGLWNDTSPITSITLNPGTGPNFVAGSSASLYGIKNLNASGRIKATGGSIASDGSYVYHVFTSSGTFTPTTDISNVEYLVIGGGGGGTQFGGGGAGGYRSSVVGELSGGGASAEARLNLTAGIGYTVTVGAGGSGSTTPSSATNGSNSAFGAITALGGGGGGVGGVGRTGGSGAGATAGDTAGSGTAGQGFAGGVGATVSGEINGGGGGGAGALGVTATSSGVAGNGGAGQASSITGTSVVRAGGGGGGIYSNFGHRTPGTGGTGGGGNGGGFFLSNNSGNPTSGTANTGGGGGGGAGSNTAANGGSGVVIVRYAV